MSFDPDKYAAGTQNVEYDARQERLAKEGHTGLQDALHMLVKGLPFAGGTVGGILAAPGMVTTAAGAGLGAGAGHALQKFVDQTLGYEKPRGLSFPQTKVTLMGKDLGSLPLPAGDVADVANTAAKDAVVAATGTAGFRMLGKAAGPLTATKEKIQDWLLGGEAGPAAREAAERAGAFDAGLSPKGTVARIDKGMDRTGKQYEEIVKFLEQQGITGADTEQLADAYMKQLAERAPRTMIPAERKVYSDAAGEMQRLGPGRLGLSQQEDLKRSAQEMAKSAYDQSAPGGVGRAHKKVAETLRKSTEDEIETQVWGRQMQPAIVDSQTGRVYTGTSHADILDRLPPHIQEKLLSDTADPLLESGFVSPTGEFINSDTMGRLTGARSSAAVAELPPARTQTLAGSGRVRGKFGPNGVLLNGKGSGPTPVSDGAIPMGTGGELAVHDPIPPPEPTPSVVGPSGGATPMGNSGLARIKDILSPGSGRPPRPYSPGVQDADLITSDVERAAQDFVPVKREYGALAKAQEGAQAHADNQPDWISNLLLSHAMLHPSSMLRVAGAMGAKKLISSRGPTTAAALLRSGARGAGALGDSATELGSQLSIWGNEEKPDISAILNALMQKKPLEQKSPDSPAFDPDVYSAGVGR
jgi:hypothetical protein